MSATVRVMTVAGAMAASMLLPAGSAHAAGGTVSVRQTDTTVEFRGGAEASDLRVTKRKGPVSEFDSIYVFDDVVTVTPGTGCVRPDEDDDTLAECTMFEAPTTEDSVNVFLGGGDDRGYVDTYGEVTLRGGDGRDRLSGTDVDRMYGDAGNDVLNARGVTDGGPGNDVISGAGLIRGGDGADLITGNDRQQTIEGGRGDDRILANGGHDFVWGNSGNDRIEGGTHSDKLYGGPGADTIFGNSGNDLVVGGAGRDTLSGGPGSDTVRP
jgi:Ca2+-binding RTX toxin-like protein